MKNKLVGLWRRYLLNAKYLIKVRKPRVWKRYFMKVLQTKLLGRVTPRQIDIALTFKCNMICEHCFAVPLFQKNKQEMSYETLKRVADDCYKLGITVIHFTGGEVLLRDDLERVIRLFRANENLIYVQSNGQLADKKRLKELKRAGLDFFSVSLENPDEDAQDKFRHCDGYFRKAMECLRMAQEVGLQTSVNITIDNKLIGSPRLSQLIEMLGDSGHIVYANLPVPVGRFKNRKDLLWSKMERNKLYELTRKYPHFRTEFDSNFGEYGCPAMKEKIYLCAYGDVIPCPYIHISFGNVNDESLIDIRERCLNFGIFRYYYDHCLAAENAVFINDVINKTHEYSVQPVPYKYLETELLKCEHKINNIY